MGELTVLYEGVKLEVRPDEEHEWLIETALVAVGYGINENSLRSTKSRNEGELLEGKHWRVLQIATPSGTQTKVFWTKKGVVRLGFFIKSERAKFFRDWAEDLILSKQPAAPAVPTNLRDALLLAAELEGQRQRLAEQVQELAPAAEYADEVLTSVSDWTTQTIAKEMGISAQRLNMELYALKVQYKNGDGVWVLYAQHAAKGYTRTRTHTYPTHRGETMTKIVTVWTEAGRRFIHELLNHRLRKERPGMALSGAN